MEPFNGSKQMVLALSMMESKIDCTNFNWCRSKLAKKLAIRYSFMGGDKYMVNTTPLKNFSILDM